MLPPSVRRFVQRRIDTVEQLEILLLLQHHADRSWNAARVADALQLTEPAAAEHLEALGRRDLLDVRLSSDVVYRYSPATAELAGIVAQVVDAYREHRGDVLRLVTGRRLRALRDFSDAFRLGDDDDG
jgi:predicted ArsR family transcriptional regulator